MITSKQLAGTLAVFMVSVLVSVAGAVEKPTSLKETCVTEECHSDYGKKTYVHAPVALGDCNSCHVLVNEQEHTFEPSRKGKDFCQYCHLEQSVRKNVHEPLKTGDCIQCHDPHSSDNKFLIPEKTIEEHCQKCHETGKDIKFPHGPVAVGECTVCHDSHTSDYNDLLTIEPNELCYSCHVVTRNELSKYETVHEPMKGRCVGCHDPHGADNPEMVKAVTPLLCYTCHTDIEEVAENSEYRHSAATGIDGCMNCHNPHASTVKSLLKKDVTSLCMTCHDKPQGISKDEVLPAFTDQLKDMKFLHGPVAEKDCTGCHITHGSKHFRLLTKEYPPIFYAPFSEKNYELCFECHNKDLVWGEKTEELTDFRNGNVNLHYLHVNKERRGRTCRACHSTHASNQAKQMRKSVPYGIWDLPVGFTKTETGGTCISGCHLPKDYDRTNPVDYSAPPAPTVTSEKDMPQKAKDDEKQSDEKKV
ncbi:MAG: cytochrome c3 family protein [Planctomycetota bacterium]|jgi:predicted CXXCH cytochrome family protein